MRHLENICKQTKSPMNVSILMLKNLTFAAKLLINKMYNLNQNRSYDDNNRYIINKRRILRNSVHQKFDEKFLKTKNMFYKMGESINIHTNKNIVNNDPEEWINKAINSKETYFPYSPRLDDFPIKANSNFFNMRKFGSQSTSINKKKFGKTILNFNLNKIIQTDKEIPLNIRKNCF